METSTPLKKTKVIFVQLGSPKSPSTKDVRSFLKHFLGDPRVVDINPILWKLILNLFVLPFRPKNSARLYKRIWDGETFPLLKITKDFTLKMRELNQSPHLEFDCAFLLSNPSISEIWDSWEKDIREENNPADKLLIIPMFPQYSESTIASGIDCFAGELKNRVKIPDFEFITNFHLSKAFIDNSIQKINNSLKKFQNEGAQLDQLVISFHGIPKRRVIYKGDDYYRHCYETFFLIKNGVKEIPPERIFMTFQSRFGSEEWLTPYTENFLNERAQEGFLNTAIYCPSFVADCLETIDEIGHELKQQMQKKGGNIYLIPCLNEDQQWCQDFYQYIFDRTLSSNVIQNQNSHALKRKIIWKCLSKKWSLHL